VRQGQEVLAFGYPRATVLGSATMTVTRGIISAIRTSEGEIQVDAALNRGNSGGPIVTLQGEVVGVVSWRVRGAEGLNVAVASNALRSTTAQLNPVAIPAPKLPAEEQPLTGVWRGIWRSVTGLGGALALELSQDDETVTGRAALSNSRFSMLDVRGRFSGDALTADGFNAATRTVTFTGRFTAPGVLEGRYNVPVFLLWDSGTWGLRKVP
jgi:S1-C subfamily serine protease